VRLASALLAVVVVGLSARACLAPSAATVPPVRAGATVDEATRQLTVAKLDALRTTQASKTVPSGRVIGTVPAAGSAVHEGDDITLVVSAGPPKVTVSSGSYAGKSPDAARSALAGLGLVPTFAYDGTGTPAGTVSSVSPAGSLSYGTAVTIHVVPVPAVAGPPGKRKKHGKHD
jgi:serine/threonine-protein kinase